MLRGAHGAAEGWPAGREEALAAGGRCRTAFLGALSRRPSAGWFNDALGGKALEGLVQFSTTSNYLALAQKQAEKLQQVVTVANLRAVEASNVLRYLEFLSRKERETDPKILIGQWASGPGFGNAEPPVFDPLAAARAAKAAAAAAAKAAKNAKSNPAGALGAMPKPPIFDLDTYYIKKALESTIEFCREAKYSSTHLVGMVGDASRKADKALRLAAEELDYPGFPAAALARPSARPLASVRPTNLAPAWMDFLYSNMTAGTDPYHGLEENNPFGSPPIKAHEIPVEFEGGDLVNIEKKPDADMKDELTKGLGGMTKGLL